MDKHEKKIVIEMAKARYCRLDRHRDIVIKLKEATASINYGCGITGDDSCINYKNKPALCCSGCAKSLGFFDGILFSEEQPIVYIENYDPELGFWRPGVGCIIDRKYRSVTCLTHGCYKHKQHIMNIKDIMLLRLIKICVRKNNIPIYITNHLCKKYGENANTIDITDDMYHNLTSIIDISRCKGIVIKILNGTYDKEMLGEKCFITRF